MIIVEGPDGAGKSTLVRHLSQKFNLRQGERGTSDRSQLYKVTRQDTYNALSQAVRGNERPKIWDRLYFSELVYADIIGRPCEFKASEQRFIGDVLDALACPVIVCRPPLTEVRANVLEHDQMAGVVENVDHIYERYEGLYFHGDFMLFDYTDPDLNVRAGYMSLASVEAVVESYINQRGERQW